MTPVDVFFAASTAGAWVLPAAGLLAAAWAIARIASWTWRLTAAALWWRRTTRTVDPAPDVVFDQLDQDLNKFAARIQGLYVKEGEQ